MQPRKGPTWANEVPGNPPAVQESSNQADGEDRPQGDLSDLEWMRQRISKQVDQDERVFEQSDDDEPLVEDPISVRFPTLISFLPNFF
jgi:multiple RNA-binding domain-containing protein 1